MAMLTRMMLCIASLYIFLWSTATPSSIAASSGNKLRVGFYRSTCPRAEEIVANAVAKYSKTDDGTIPGIIRLLFHDCVIKGCDASILVKNTSKLRTEMANFNQLNTLRGFDALEAAKAELEKECPGTVSCADVIAFAARDATVLMGNPSYSVPAGRRDSLTSNLEDANVLPGPNWNVTQQINLFAEKGFSVDDLVVLLGSHGIGRSHCWNTFALPSFTLANLSYVGPFIDPVYREMVVHKLCYGLLQKSIIWFQYVPLDSSNGVFKQNVPGNWGSVFYKNILIGKEPLPSDLALALDPRTKDLVVKYANDPKLWATKFNDAMIRLGSWNVLTGQQGNIRKVCGVLNN